MLKWKDRITPHVNFFQISNKSQKKGENGMGKRWRKADCVKKARMSRMRDLRVRELLVTFFMIRKNIQNNKYKTNKTMKRAQHLNKVDYL